MKSLLSLCHQQQAIMIHRWWCIPLWWGLWNGFRSATACGDCTAGSWRWSAATAAPPPPPRARRRTSAPHPSASRLSDTYIFIKTRWPFLTCGETWGNLLKIFFPSFNWIRIIATCINALQQCQPVSKKCPTSAWGNRNPLPASLSGEGWPVRVKTNDSWWVCLFPKEMECKSDTSRHRTTLTNSLCMQHWQSWVYT